ncbi:MAG: sulfite exporter TauE/SafE family protein, partial [Rhizobiaceae bacterium]
MLAEFFDGIAQDWQVLALSSGAIFIAAIVRGFSGFGYSLLSITAISLILPVQDIVPSIFLLEVAASLNL